VIIEPRIFHGQQWGFTLGDEAIELAAMTGLDLFDWEQEVLRESLGVREDGKWASFEMGLIVARQNGKGSILEARELAGLFLLGEQLIIHSAHEFSTSLEAFTRILERIESCPDLDKQVARVSRSHGEEGIDLRKTVVNGKEITQRLRFRTRTKGGGRGFTGDCIILDEAMYLTGAQVQALLPTMSARSIQGNPQVWLTGSAGDKESIALGAMRDRAIAGTDPDMTFMEWSADGCTDFCNPDLRDYKCPDHDAIDDPVVWHKANPSMDLTISREFIARELRMQKHDVEKFKQERLSIGDWPTPKGFWRLIKEDTWLARVSEIEEALTPFTFAIDTSPSRSHSCITVAGADGKGGVCVEITSGEVLDYRPGTSWVVDRAVELNRKWKPSGFVIDLASQAGELKDELEAKGIRVISPTSREYAQACGKMYSAIVPSKNNEPYVWHRNQSDLNNAVRGADKRKLAGLWALDRANESADISPFVCATLALWGHEKTSLEKTTSVACAWG
jgi:hypothetical protein